MPRGRQHCFSLPQLASTAKPLPSKPGEARGNGLNFLPTGFFGGSWNEGGCVSQNLVCRLEKAALYLPPNLAGRGSPLKPPVTKPRSSLFTVEAWNGKSFADMGKDIQQIRTCPHCGQAVLFGPGCERKIMYCPKCDTPLRLNPPRHAMKMETFDWLRVLIGTVTGTAAGVVVANRGEGRSLPVSLVVLVVVSLVAVIVSWVPVAGSSTDRVIPKGYAIVVLFYGLLLSITLGFLMFLPVGFLTIALFGFSKPLSLIWPLGIYASTAVAAAFAGRLAHLVDRPNRQTNEGDESGCETGDSR
jgi:hypothetical protein